MSCEQEICRQIKELSQAGITATQASKSCVKVKMWPPRSSPYEDSKLGVKLYLPADYPLSPPEYIVFDPPIWHPNVDSSTASLLETWSQDGWESDSRSLLRVLKNIGILLLKPNLGGNIDNGPGKEYQENPNGFEARARKWAYCMDDYIQTYGSCSTKLSKYHAMLDEVKHLAAANWLGEELDRFRSVTLSDSQDWLCFRQLLDWKPNFKPEVIHCHLPKTDEIVGTLIEKQLLKCSKFSGLDNLSYW
ncbi:hypothetical protein Tsubulata_038410 [Turnera subulata]|uniref:UBC core domain-containing protein n=1 Tax=Turnera subulata TaxID=218843 RepID=A0A9Q0J520_9ROSI|nr:hypothetical protein Tsubulata_038410 [Turnera subulata]